VRVAFKTFKLLAENQTCLKIKTIQTYNAKEFHYFKSLINEYGMQHHFTCLHTRAKWCHWKKASTYSWYGVVCALYVRSLWMFGVTLFSQLVKLSIFFLLLSYKVRLLMSFFFIRNVIILNLDVLVALVILSVVLIILTG